MSQETQQVKNKVLNVMRKPRITKVTLSSGATGKDLEKATKLLEIISEAQPQIIKSGPRRRIPAFSVKPNMPLGVMVTVRGERATKLLRKLLGAVDNILKKKQVSPNTFSFGIKEYIEIPGIEYDRDIGIRGFHVTISFERPGVRVKRRKIKQGRLPKTQIVTEEEIITFMKETFKTTFE